MKQRFVITGLVAFVLGVVILVSAQIAINSVTKGDVNEDGNINVVDALWTSNIILGIPYPEPPATDSQLCAADANGDWNVNVLDVLFIVNVILYPEEFFFPSSCDELDCDDSNSCTADSCDPWCIQCLHADLSSGTIDLQQVEFCLSVNAIITPSLEDRLKIFDFIGAHIKEDGHLVLVVPSLESALFCDFRQIESNLRSGLRPSAAVNADFQTRKSLRNSDGLFEGNILIDDVPTKHYLKEELIAVLAERDLSITGFSKIEYPWSAEFISAPRWMSDPYPWDWLVIARKN